MADDPLDLAISRADLDALIRLIDAHCATADYDGLTEVFHRSRAAVHTGRQLWPAATLAAYRLALRAPAELAAAMLDTDVGRFTIGPLSEVIAQHHTWSELAPLLEPSPSTIYVAHERALRGERIDPDSLRHLPAVIEVPAELEPWEPTYPLAIYHDDRAEFPTPEQPRGAERISTSAGAVRVDDDTDHALRLLVEPWISGSDGRAESAAVIGDAPAALGALGIGTATIAPLTPGEALAWLAWTGASGGAYGRRRGAAAGRDLAWWLLATMADLTDPWPCHADDLGAFASEVDWYWWDAGEPTTGWRLQIVVSDPVEDKAWAFSARDAR